MLPTFSWLDKLLHISMIPTIYSTLYWLSVLTPLIELCVWQDQREKCVLNAIMYTFQANFIDHKECFNCSIKYPLHTLFVVNKALLAYSPRALVQANSPCCAGWLINPASSKQKANHWIAFIDLQYMIALMIEAENNVAVSFMSINK